MTQPDESDIDAQPFLGDVLLLRDELTAMGPPHACGHSGERAAGMARSEAMIQDNGFRRKPANPCGLVTSCGLVP